MTYMKIKIKNLFLQEIKVGQDHFSNPYLTLFIFTPILIWVVAIQSILAQSANLPPLNAATTFPPSPKGMEVRRDHWIISHEKFLKVSCSVQNPKMQDAFPNSLHISSIVSLLICIYCTALSSSCILICYSEISIMSKELIDISNALTHVPQKWMLRQQL